MNFDQNINADVRVGIIGFGEVGQAFAKGMKENTEHIFIYDLLLETNQVLKDRVDTIGVKAVDSIKALGEDCTLIFSLVNSAASVEVAKNIATKINKGTVFIDLTTSTPLTKEKSEKVITDNQGIYVDGAIMGTVVTEQHRVPLLIAGANANTIKVQLNSLGLNAQSIDHPNGGAASIKLLRSVFMKGVEALIIETMTAAKIYGVSSEVMQSISKTINNNDFNHFANTLITTHVIHKERRYKEVLDSSKLVKEAHLHGFVTDGVTSFFSNSVKMNINNQLNNVDKILNQYIQQENNTVINK